MQVVALTREPASSIADFDEVLAKRDRERESQKQSPHKSTDISASPNMRTIENHSKAFVAGIQGFGICIFGCV